MIFKFHRILGIISRIHFDISGLCSISLHLCNGLLHVSVLDWRTQRDLRWSNWGSWWSICRFSESTVWIRSEDKQRHHMALFRRFFYRKPPDRLLEISERVYGTVFVISIWCSKLFNFVESRMCCWLRNWFTFCLNFEVG